jgi:hypothetical protein
MELAERLVNQCYSEIYVLSSVMWRDYTGGKMEAIGIITSEKAKGETV